MGISPEDYGKMRDRLERAHRKVSGAPAPANLPQSPEPKRPVRLKSVAAQPAGAGDAGRRRVHVVSYRRRLIDPDNLCVKQFVDALRHVKILRGDSAKDIVISVDQKKVSTEEEECTEIVITKAETTL